MSSPNGESVIETARLVLRRFATNDLENLVVLDSDPEVMRYLTGGSSTPRRVIEDEILPRFLQGGYWAAIERRTGDFIGWFSLNPPKETTLEFELGYRLRRSAWGKGFATEGCLAVIDRAFTELGARRVVANTYQDNLASRRVMERIGMKYVRSYRITIEDLVHTGTFDVASNELWDGDDVEYELLEEAWEQQVKYRSLAANRFQRVHNACDTQ